MIFLLCYIPTLPCLCFSGRLLGPRQLAGPWTRPTLFANLARQAAPCAAVEYCGSLAYRKTDYYLFVLEQNQLSGLVLIVFVMRAAPAPRTQNF